MEEKKENRKFNQMDTLVLFTIAKYLEAKDVIQAFSRLNRRCREVGKHNSLWRKIIVHEALLQHASLRPTRKKAKSKK